MLFDASLNYSDSFFGNFVYNSDDFSEALNVFTNDYPVYYYWRNKINTSYSKFNFKTSLENKINVKENIEELISIKDQILEKCINENNYETVKNIHDYLIDSIEYDIDASNAHNLYGALVDKKCVCDSYALAFKLFIK